MSAAAAAPAPNVAYGRRKRSNAVKKNEWAFAGQNLPAAPPRRPPGVVTVLSAARNALSGDAASDALDRCEPGLVVVDFCGNALGAKDKKAARAPLRAQALKRHASSLAVLLASENALRGCAAWASACTHLNTLVLSKNALSAPPDLSSLPLLRKLSLSHNKLKELPDVGLTPLLSELRAAHNRIPGIAVESGIANHPALSIVDLGHNAIAAWRGEAHLEILRQLPNLKQLSLAGNPIAGGPVEPRSAEGEPPAEVPPEVAAARAAYSEKMGRWFPRLKVRDGRRCVPKETAPAHLKEAPRVKPPKPAPGSDGDGDGDGGRGGDAGDVGDGADVGTGAGSATAAAGASEARPAAPPAAAAAAAAAPPPEPRKKANKFEALAQKQKKRRAQQEAAAAGDDSEKRAAKKAKKEKKKEKAAGGGESRTTTAGVSGASGAMRVVTYKAAPAAKAAPSAPSAALGGWGS